MLSIATPTLLVRVPSNAIHSSRDLLWRGHYNNRQHTYYTVIDLCEYDIVQLKIFRTQQNDDESYYVIDHYEMYMTATEQTQTERARSYSTHHEHNDEACNEEPA